MNIVHIASELTPVAKIGGLADVLHGLCRALIAKGHTTSILLPKYDTLNLNQVKDLEIIDNRFDSYFDGVWHENTVWTGFVDSIPVYFIEPHHPLGLFNRGKVYGCDDDALRFAYFSRASLDFLVKMEAAPDIIHLHDWHTALIAPLAKSLFSHKLNAGIVFTIHNLAYQGQCGKELFSQVGWQGDSVEKAQDPVHKDAFNLMKAGIIFSDRVTTVSPTYAKELLETSLGGALATTLREEKNKFTGILNGIDTDHWNPDTDLNLPENYNKRNFLTGKQKNKTDLRDRLSLGHEKSPLVAIITRLVPQKGPDLIKAALLRTLEHGGQFVLLGSAHEGNILESFYNLKRAFAGSRHVHLELTYNEELSHQLFAAADLFLVPSIFEPCGLTQMISMRYGTPPLVRHTGGLSDTVFEGRNGFVFGPPTAEAISSSVDRALAQWWHQPDEWGALIKTCMECDYSWEKSSEEYLSIYKALL